MEHLARDPKLSAIVHREGSKTVGSEALSRILPCSAQVTERLAGISGHTRGMAFSSVFVLLELYPEFKKLRELVRGAPGEEARPSLCTKSV